jgi:hypothetical protein
MQVISIVAGSNLPTWSLNEKKKKLTVEGVVVDLEESVRDCQTIINITNDNGKAVLGLGGKNGYIADIEIPPREYEFTETGTGTAKVSTKTPLPLDVATVTLKLWPFGEA